MIVLFIKWICYNRNNHLRDQFWLSILTRQGLFCCFRPNIFSWLCESTKARCPWQPIWRSIVYIIFFAQIHKFHYFKVFLQIFSTCVRIGTITLVLGFVSRLQPSPRAKALWLGLICSQSPRPWWWFLKEALIQRAWPETTKSSSVVMAPYLKTQIPDVQYRGNYDPWCHFYFIFH